MVFGERREREPQVHLVFDLDDTLVTSREHWPRAALAGVLTIAHTPGFKITSRKYLRKFGEWAAEKTSGEKSDAEKLRGELSEMMDSEVSLEEAFLFHVLHSEIYAKDPNDLRQFDKLVKRVNGSWTAECEVHGVCEHHHHEPTTVRSSMVKEVAQKAGETYNAVTSLNVQRGILRAMPNAPEFVVESVQHGWNTMVVSKGHYDKQWWKVENLLLPQMGGVTVPLFTTDRRFFSWRLKPGEKTPRFLEGVKRQMGYRKGDLLVMVGNSHNSDIVPAIKAGFHYTIHVPDAREAHYLDNRGENQAHEIVEDLAAAMEKVRARVAQFEAEGK